MSFKQTRNSFQSTNKFIFTHIDSAPTHLSPVPPKLLNTRSPLTSRRTEPLTQELPESGIYEVPCHTQNVTEGQDKKRNSHYYTKITQSEDSTAPQLVSGVSAHQPPTAPKPKPKRRITTASKNTLNQGLLM